MACNLKRIADLPIREDYKIAMIQHFQKPENAAACERLNQASDEQIMALIQNMDETIAGQRAPNQGPGLGPGPGQGQPVQPQAGIGAMPPARPPPPQPTGAVPSPMDTPMPGAPGGINMLPKRY
jgi:hypothetical protein